MENFERILIPEELLERIENAIITGKTNVRKLTSYEIAMHIAEIYLRKCCGIDNVTKLDPAAYGYDLLADGIRVQVKGCSLFNYIQGIYKNMEFDISIIVDIGSAIKRRPEKYSNTEKYPLDNAPSIFVFSQNDIARNLFYNKNSPNVNFVFAKKNKEAHAISVEKGLYKDFYLHKNRSDIVNQCIKTSTEKK